MPNEAKTVESANSLRGDVAWLAILELLVLTALVVDPCSQFGVVRVVSRYNAMSMLLLVSSQFIQSLQPCSLMCVPTKANSIELSAASLGHMRLFALLHQCVVATLFLDPQAQLGECGIVWTVLYLPLHLHI